MIFRFLVFLLVISPPRFIWACSEFIRPFPLECDLQDRYLKVKNELLDKFNFDVDFINEYRALRFIGRNSWEKALAKKNPYAWKIYEPAPSTWLQWENGASRIATLIDEKLDLQKMNELHIEVISQEIMTRTSVWLKGNRPGKIRSDLFQASPSFAISCEDGGLSKSEVEFLTSYDLKDQTGAPLVKAKTLQCNEQRGRYMAYVKYLKSKDVPIEIHNWIWAFNDSLEEITSNRSTKSPLQLAADLQRRFISIHPYGDGNGRMSRLLQDLFLKKLDLPYAPSGDLKNDIITNTKTYREDFIESVKAQVTFLEKCLREYQEDNVSDRCISIYSSRDIERNKFKQELDQFIKVIR